MVCQAIDRLEGDCKFACLLLSLFHYVFIIWLGLYWTRRFLDDSDNVKRDLLRTNYCLPLCLKRLSLLWKIKDEVTKSTTGSNKPNVTRISTKYFFL